MKTGNSIKTKKPLKKQILHDCRIVSIRELTDDIFMLELDSALISRNCTPGQFVNVECDKFLRRPISICGVDMKKGTFNIAIKVKGSGTEFLHKQKIGAVISAQGPLGKGFSFDGVEKCVIVGGGIGVFPLLFLLNEATKLNIDTITICGYRSPDEALCLNEIKSLSGKTLFASDCGGLDFCGNAAEALKSLGRLSDYTVFSCGPYPMMKSVAEYCATNKINCFVSLEERMGCGTGVCLVCACKTKSDITDFEYKRCCCDGPVFNALEVAWD